MKPTQQLRQAVDHSLDAYAMINFSQGFEEATNGLDELSDLKHNTGDTAAAEILRWAAKELRGENAENAR
jgi:hypothetical protein